MPHKIPPSFGGSITQGQLDSLQPEVGEAIKLLLGHNTYPRSSMKQDKTREVGLGALAEAARSHGKKVEFSPHVLPVPTGKALQAGGGNTSYNHLNNLYIEDPNVQNPHRQTISELWDLKSKSPTDEQKDIEDEAILLLKTKIDDVNTKYTAGVEKGLNPKVALRNAVEETSKECLSKILAEKGISLRDLEKEVSYGDETHKIHIVSRSDGSFFFEIKETKKSDLPCESRKKIRC